MKKLFAPLLPAALGLLLGACVSSPDSRLQAQLQALPLPVENGQSAVLLNREQIYANTAKPSQVIASKTAAKFEDYERALTAVREPAEANDKAMRSLSYYASLSLLDSCNQVCGLKISEEQGVAGQFVTFNCDGLVLNLRDYYPGHGKQGFTLSRDKVNLLINGQPAWLKRSQSATGEGSTFLAWQGADRGFALFSASAEDAVVEKLVALAESISAVQP